MAAVKDKSFRIDLFYRLRVVSFFLPPLRDRVEDIPLLVSFFVNRFARKYGKKNIGIAPEALDLLLSHPWEGNIREMKNVIDSAIVLSNGGILMPENLDPFIAKKERREHGPVTDNYYAYFRSLLEPVFDRICLKENGTVYENINTGLEKALVEMAMAKTKNNQVAVSKLLGISRNTLRDRLERYNIGNN